MLLGLGFPEWLTIAGLVGGLWLTFKLMARASVAYEQARERRDGMAAQAAESRDAADDQEVSDRFREDG